MITRSLLLNLRLILDSEIHSRNEDKKIKKKDQSLLTMLKNDTFTFFIYFSNNNIIFQLFRGFLVFIPLFLPFYDFISDQINCTTMLSPNNSGKGSQYKVFNLGASGKFELSRYDFDVTRAFLRYASFKFPIFFKILTQK